MREGDPAIEVKVENGRAVVQLPAPFVSRAEAPRFSMDRDVVLDLTRATSITLKARGTGTDEKVQVSVYFHSANGWYSGSANLTGPGWRTLTFPKDDFRVEGSPGMWGTIDQIRISFWPNEKERKDTSFQLTNLQAHWNNTAIILSRPEDPDFKTCEEIAGRMKNMLRETGIGADLIPGESLPSGTLGDRPLAILPYNPRMDKKAIAALNSYVGGGGKLFVCYSLPPGLGDSLGFGRGNYVREERAGYFAAIQFDADDIPGLPEKVSQASWNINTARPVSHHARIIAHWLNGDGKSTGQPAVLISDRGAYFSHILLPDDPANKKAMLTSLLGKLNLDLWKEAARNGQLDAARVGHCHSLGDLETFVGDGPGFEKLEESKSAMAHSAKLLKDGNAFDAYEVALRGPQLRVEAYLLSHPSRPVEARAFWNHSGTGAYPGDWERSAREMEAAGMNMVLPNILWGGQAHYPSDVLPRSKTFETFGDQIEQCLAAAHKHGIEVHIWKVNFNLGHGVPQDFIDQLRKEGRLQVSVDGEPTNWLNPAHPKNFQLELDAILEVIRNYDIDGFHFDYIRYPNSKNDFSDYSRDKFQADTGLGVKNWPADCYDGPLQEAYTNWRCSNITRLVKEVSEQARKIRPGIKISAAVFRDYPNCRRWVAQDWLLWAKKGYVDFLCPMDYTDDDEQYLDWITRQKSQLPEGFPLYPGIGISLRGKTQSVDRVLGQVYLNRKVDTGGFTIFNLNKTTLQSVSFGLSLGAGKTKAIPPHRVTQ